MFRLYSNFIWKEKRFFEFINHKNPNNQLKYEFRIAGKQKKK